MYGDSARIGSTTRPDSHPETPKRFYDFQIRDRVEEGIVMYFIDNTGRNIRRISPEWCPEPPPSLSYVTTRLGFWVNNVTLTRALTFSRIPLLGVLRGISLMRKGLSARIVSFHNGAENKTRSTCRCCEGNIHDSAESSPAVASPIITGHPQNRIMGIAIVEVTLMA